jgi:soluble lytic murein transglycosylase-like protein
MRRWCAHAFVLTAVVASVILTGRFANASVESANVATNSTTAPTEPRPDNTAGFTPKVERWRALSLTTSDAVRQATGVSLDDNLLLALVAVESGGDPGARSRAGAVGLTQVEPSTFHDLQARYRQVLGSGGLEEPRTNLLAGGMYLVDCARQLHADLADPSGLDLVLKAYNLGPRAASEWRATGTWLDASVVEYALPTETVEHSARIVATYRNTNGTDRD